MWHIIIGSNVPLSLDYKRFYTNLFIIRHYALDISDFGGSTPPISIKHLS